MEFGLKIIIILDGIAEDRLSHASTTLELAYTPFLDKIAQKSTCGLFCPVDSRLHMVKTELVIASLLGIRPQLWPGRAYFEVLYNEPRSIPPKACSFIRYKSIGEKDGKVVESHLIKQASFFSSLAQSYGVQIRVRPHQQTASSHLAWVRDKKLSPKDAMEQIKFMFAKILNVFPQNIHAVLDEEWFGDPIQMKSFCKKPCFIAHTQNALGGLCQAAGIEVIPPNGHPLDFNNNRRLFQQIEQYLANSDYNCSIIYCKSTDWASHHGDRVLKKKTIEFIDSWLQQIISPLLGNPSNSIFVLSDHRTNIASEQASMNDSIFMTYNNGKGISKFCEKAIEQQWTRKPLSLDDLFYLFFNSPDSPW